MKVTVIAHPNAKKPRIQKDLFGVLHVYVNQPPLEGKANEAVVASLAKFYRVRKTDIILLSGQKNKNKTFEIQDR